MEWAHQVSQGWLHARKEVITATELVKLRSGFSRLSKAQQTGIELAPNFAALWGAKHSDEELNPMSYGAAARGHWCEPYAVDDFNINIEKEKRWKYKQYYHWDDCIIVNEGIGFSPDAMNIPQVTTDVRLDVAHGKIQNYNDEPKSILEIKSYGAEAHMKAAIKESIHVDERWQLAAAMIVLPCIEEGILLFYNPSIPEYSMSIHTYDRDSLQKEIEELQKIISVWQATCRWFNNNEIGYKATHTEQEINRLALDYMSNDLL